MTDLNAQDRAHLLQHARACLRAAVAGEAPPDVEPLPREHGGVFVTLKKDGALRGCIGRFDGRTELAQLTGDMTRAAALEDPRFPAVTPEEVDALSISVSRLSSLSARARPRSIEVGKHGVQLELRGRRAVFLPDVATEQGWDREQLLAALCRKAGLGPDDWRQPATRIHLFQAEVFSE